MSDHALEWVEAQTWPGNVRDLRTALRHAMVMAGSECVIDVAHFPEAESLPSGKFAVEAPSHVSSLSEMRTVPEEPASLRELEAGAVERAIAAANGNMSEAARILGVARSTLYRMIKRDRSRDG